MSKYTQKKTEEQIRHEEQVRIAFKLRAVTEPPMDLAWFARKVLGITKQNFNYRINKLKEYYPQLNIEEIR